MVVVSVCDGCWFSTLMLKPKQRSTHVLEFREFKADIQEACPAC